MIPDLSAASDLLISNITELKGWRGVSGVTSMEGMLAGQSRLESVSITEANMPNLTNTANMFSGCTKLTEVDLSGWTGMESTAITGMFSNAPANIDLIADSDAIGTAIKEEYEKNTSTVRKTMENAGVKSIKKIMYKEIPNLQSQNIQQKKILQCMVQLSSHW